VSVKGHSGCDECKLNKPSADTWLPPHDLNYNAKYFFILGQNKPGAIKQAKKLLTAHGIDPSESEFVFGTRCWAGDDVKAQDREANKCSGLLQPILEQVSSDSIIVPMGATPCKVVAKAKSIQTAHGTVIRDTQNRVIIPTLNPAQTIAYPESLPAFESDLEVIKSAAKGQFTVAEDTEYQLVTDIPAFKQMVAELWMSKAYATDTENTTLNPFRKTSTKLFPEGVTPAVLGLSFANRAKHAWYLPIDHKDHVWNAKERTYIVKMLKVLLEATHNVKVLHNGKYDIKYLRKVLDIYVGPGNFVFDTLLAHYVAVNEVTGTHGLDILAWEFTDMGGYDEPLQEYKRLHPEANPDAANGGHYGNIPLSLLWKYGAGDADVTFRLYDKFKPIIDEKFYNLYYHIMIPALHTLANIEFTGAPIDKGYLKECQASFPILLQAELDRMREFPELIAVEKELIKLAKKRKARERVKRYSVRSQLILKVQETDPVKAEKLRKKLVGDIERAKNKPILVKPIAFNPKSSAQVVMLFYDFLGFTHHKRTKEGNRSADKEVLKNWWFEHKHPVVMAVGRYVKLYTLYSMFVRDLDQFMGDDGRVRCSYNLAGTETGRLSCAEPNLQQIPKNLKEDAREPFVDPSWPSIKQLFSSLGWGGKYNTADWVVYQFDYSQAELRVLAALSRDPVLLGAYARGEDVHQRVAAEIFGKSLEDVTPFERDIAKRINFGLLYGQGPRKLAAMVGITVETAKAYIADYFKKLKGVKRWIDARKKIVRETGESWSPFGRLRRLMSAFSPDDDIVARAERQGVNSPIQAAASDCTLMSLARIDKFLRENNLLSRIIITVHDSIVLLVHRTEVVHVYSAVKDIMQSPENDGWLKGVTMVADAEMGRHWGSLRSIKKPEDIPVNYQELYGKELPLAA
jgi:DNA polymerase I-like protein with 3'-5' exonuclease and polymerase domains